MTFAEFVEKQGYSAEDYLTFSVATCKYLQKKYQQYLENK